LGLPSITRFEYVTEKSAGANNLAGGLLFGIPRPRHLASSGFVPLPILHIFNQLAFQYCLFNYWANTCKGMCKFGDIS
jgi:hypothetical protein